jgi:hypothetical protein
MIRSCGIVVDDGFIGLGRSIDCIVDVDGDSHA